MNNIDDIQTFRMNFHKNYHEFLVPNLYMFEKQRKWQLFKAILWTIVLLCASAAYFWFMIKFEIKGKHSADLGVILLILGLSQYYLHKKMFEGTLKAKFIQSICNCFGNIKYKSYYSNEDLRIFPQVGLFPDFTTSITDDCFKGKYKNVNIEIIESEFEKGSGKNSTTVFNGLLIKLDMNKNFKGHTLLMEDKFLHKSPLPNLRHTELEDVKFEKKYDVFTNDEIEARYILTPTFMERLTAIKTAFKCKSVRCAFYANQLFIAMATKQDLFSLGSLVKPVADPKQFTDFCAQFVSILALIDHLKLDKKAIL